MSWSPCPDPVPGDRARMGRAGPAPAAVLPPSSSTPAVNSPIAAPAKPQRRDVVKRQPSATAKITPQRAQTTVRQNAPAVKPPVVVVRKQPNIIPFPERQPLLPAVFEPAP